MGKRIVPTEKSGHSYEYPAFMKNKDAALT